eukprot:m.110356 g.110356  ORF g.110356 m.110356 type:complete len:93 (+) comp37390_c0_seq1:280-558(+)
MAVRFGIHLRVQTHFPAVTLLLGKMEVGTGYGCASLFWLQKNRPELTNRYSHAGTVQDFLVACLCQLQVPVMSYQNAASWGYLLEDKWEMSK